ncbi:Thioredoxin reductase protein [Halorhabdus tiamatea SARL4B]|uniref:Thioredoxin reductase n=1 Tax=Halorhabdus tiamatea SARL4B TaxID=1033806 RepID=F7PF34_9EURY|nr:NAD(P)/FAD-dependent oxidoreductase [Halorhabdus tiamatea]ERJ06022.1 Thioredoxin reductase protein [Halorhabdus tiamatea SARL4B]CCQ34416.1 thioredoxin reductase [Halorhabdus tiamatea SARL4B]
MTENEASSHTTSAERDGQGGAATTDHDVIVVGSGPAGCSAGVFTARYGLDTLVLDRGQSSLGQCAVVENYPGFPAGIGVETLSALFEDHAAEAGCDVVPELVERVDRPDDERVDQRPEGSGFLVETAAGNTHTADRVIAATRYGGAYLQPVLEVDAFQTPDGDDGRTRLDRSFPDRDGGTPVDGLFVASPSKAADRQAIVAAGRGARVGIAVVEAVRRDQGYPPALAPHYDWVRPEERRAEEWGERETWREVFAERWPADRDGDRRRYVELREREIDRRLAAYRSPGEIEATAERGQRRLLEHLDEDLVLERATEIAADRDTVEVDT